MTPLQFLSVFYLIHSIFHNWIKLLRKWIKILTLPLIGLKLLNKLPIPAAYSRSRDILKSRELSIVHITWSFRMLWSFTIVQTVQRNSLIFKFSSIELRSQRDSKTRLLLVQRWSKNIRWRKQITNGWPRKCIELSRKLVIAKSCLER